MPSANMSNKDGIELREYFDLKISELEKRMCAKYQFQEQSLVLAKEVLDHRLENMNQIREQLNRQSGTFMTRERAEMEHALFAEKVDQLLLWKAEQEGKHSRSNVISIVAIIVAAISVAVHLLK